MEPIVGYDDNVVVDKKEYDALRAENERLKERERLLDALEATGVDNWQGYDEAIDLLEQGGDGH